MLVAAFIGTVVWRVGIDQKADQLASEIATLVESGKLAEARRLFDENRDLSTKEVWLAARRRLEDAERDDAQREAALTAAVESATSAASYAQAAPHLKIARERAVTSDEKLQVARLEREWQDRRNSEFKTNESGFRAAAAAAAEVLSRLDRDLAEADVATLRTAMKQAETAVGSLLPLSTGVRPEVAREREVLAARLAALRSAVDERADRESLYAGMTSALSGDGGSGQAVERFVAGVEGYRQRFPKDPRSAEFGETVAEAELWRAAVRWRDLADQWPAFRPGGSEVEARAAAIDAYLAAHPTSPSAASATRYAAFLRSVAGRSGEEGVNARLTELFRAPLIGGPLHVVRTRGEKVYYLTAPADFQDGLAAPVKYVIGPDPSVDSKSALLKKSDLASLASKPAPQVSLAEAAVRDLSRATPADWDGLILDHAKRTLSAEGLDPFVRHLLLTELLTAAGDGNSFLAESLAGVQSRLQDDDIDPAARWMDPDNAEAASVRQRAAAAVRRVSAADLDAAWRAAADQERVLATDVLQAPRVIGWLSKEEARWVCHLAREFGETPPASVVIQDGGTASWQSVGRIGRRGEVPQNPALKQGRLVFAAVGPSAARSAGAGPRVGTNP